MSECLFLVWCCCVYYFLTHNFCKVQRTTLLVAKEDDPAQPLVMSYSSGGLTNLFNLRFLIHGSCYIAHDKPACGVFEVTQRCKQRYASLVAAPAALRRTHCGGIWAGIVSKQPVHPLRAWTHEEVKDIKVLPFCLVSGHGLCVSGTMCV